MLAVIWDRVWKKTTDRLRPSTNTSEAVKDKVKRHESLIVSFPVFVPRTR